MLDDSRTTSAKTWNNNHTIVRMSKGTRGQNNTKICHCHSYKKSIIPILRLTIYKHTTLEINCKIKMKSDRHGMSVKNPCLLLLTEVKSQNTIQIFNLILPQKKKKRLFSHVCGKPAWYLSIMIVRRRSCQNNTKTASKKAKLVLFSKWQKHILSQTCLV